MVGQQAIFQLLVFDSSVCGAVLVAEEWEGLFDGGVDVVVMVMVVDVHPSP